MNQLRLLAVFTGSYEILFGKDEPKRAGPDPCF